MPEGFIQLPPNSTGLKSHTFQRVIGANTVEDEVIIHGEPYLASAIVHAQMVTTTANSHLLQIMAPAGSKVRIRRIEMWQAAVATAVAFMNTQLYRLTTAGTGGTVITPSVLDPADAVTLTAMSLPTAKGTEGVAIARAEPWMMQTLAASSEKTGPILVWDFDMLRTKPLIIAAGVTNGIAIKNATAVSPAVVDINVWLDETSF